MGRRKFRIYCDADLDGEIEDALRALPKVNCDSARKRAMTTRSDDDHYHLAAKTGRVLVTHDDGFLNEREHPMMETSGVIVIKRGQNKVSILRAFLQFLEWFWAPRIRDGLNRSYLGWLKVDLSTEGFRYWARTDAGTVESSYVEFFSKGTQRTAR